MINEILPAQWLAPLQAWRDSVRSNNTTVNEVDPPKSGEVWSIAWDAKLVGVVMVGQFNDSHAQVYPVVPSAGVANSGVAQIALGHERAGADVWLAAGFGMGNYLFECRIGRPFSGEELRERIRSMDHFVDEKLEPGTPAEKRVHDVAERVVTFAQTVCAVEWPKRQVGQATLAIPMLEDHELTVRLLGRLLDVAPGAATALWNGTALPTTEIVEKLQWETGLTAQELLQPFDGPEERELSKPVSKSRVQSLIRERTEAESSVRAEALRRSLRPGRQRSGLTVQESARARVDHALDELLRGQ